MTIPILAFQQFAFSETLKTERSHIHCSGFTIEHPLNQAGACGRGGLEAGST
jgi:hypothetical protein